MLVTDWALRLSEVRSIIASNRAAPSRCDAVPLPASHRNRLRNLSRVPRSHLPIARRRSLLVNGRPGGPSEAPARAEAGKAYRVTDIELASRLSFFLWSTIPDDELLDVAERGRLRNPAVLQQQVVRMLADKRADALIANFAGQWLHLRNVEQTKPDPFIFPFDEFLRQAFMKEASARMDELLATARPLYAALSPEQQKTADDLMARGHRGRDGQHRQHGGPRPTRG